jgi:hypothetical protein
MFVFKAIALAATAALLVWMYYFMLGGGPLLLVRHRAPNDFRMVRGFFDVHYKASMAISTVAALSFALAERYCLSATMAAVALFAFAARSMVLPRMDRLREAVAAADAVSIRAFRRVHVAGFVVNVLVMAAMTWTVSRPSLAFITCVDVPPGCQGAECRRQCSL